MANINALKGRIESIDKTASITKAMHQIAASRLTATQNLYTNYHLFNDAFYNVLSDVIDLIPNNRYILGNPDVKRVLYILITSDKGLAGAYHQQLFASFKDYIKDYDPKDVDVIVIGKKGFVFAKKQTFNLLNTYPVLNKDNVTLANYEHFIDEIEKKYLEKKYHSVHIVYTKFENTLKQYAEKKQLLPVDLQPLKDKGNGVVYEGVSPKIIDEILKIYIQTSIFGTMVEAKLSEFSMRINAMQQASDNAKEVSDTLKIKYNQARQQKITNDLLDIVNGKDI